jgi:heme oxygenase
MFLDRIHAALRAPRAALARTPFASARQIERISRDGYLAVLAQLGQIHAALEADASAVELPSELMPPARALVIACDLAALGFDGDILLTEASVRLIDRFADWAAEEPTNLLGALFVLEGTRTGSITFVRALAEVLDVPLRPDAGIDYHLDGLAGRTYEWSLFKARLASLDLTEAQRDGICRAAAETMAALAEIYETSVDTPVLTSSGV